MTAQIIGQANSFQLVREIHRPHRRPGLMLDPAFADAFLVEAGLLGC